MLFPFDGFSSSYWASGFAVLWIYHWVYPPNSLPVWLSFSTSAGPLLVLTSFLRGLSLGAAQPATPAGIRFKSCWTVGSCEMSFFCVDPFPWAPGLLRAWARIHGLQPSLLVLGGLLTGSIDVTSSCPPSDTERLCCHRLLGVRLSRLPRYHRGPGAVFICLCAPYFVSGF